MKIIKQSEANHVLKPEGTSVWYYLRDEYELHYNEQAPGTTQTWHHHDKILESLYMIEGELMAKWRENNEIKEQIVSKGDLIETENTSHTFENKTNKIVKFIVIKQVLTGIDKKNIMKNDKIID